MEYKQGGFFKRVAKALVDTEKLKTPVVVKEATEVVQRIEQYKNTLNKTADSVEMNRIQEQIKLLELGLKGEKSVLFMETKTPCYAGGSKKLLAMDKKNTPVVQ